MANTQTASSVLSSVHALYKKACLQRSAKESCSFPPQYLSLQPLNLCRYICINKKCNWTSNYICYLCLEASSSHIGSVTEGSHAVTKFCSRLSSRSISSASSSNSKIVMFSIILFSLEALGSGTKPFCMLHLNNTCAGVTAFLPAIAGCICIQCVETRPCVVH